MTAHFCYLRVVPLVVCLCAQAVVGATVELSASAAAVGEGGSLTFTCTVTPSTYVSKVTFSYEDGSASDEDTTSPYQVSHEFSTGMTDLTVTATVTYSNDDPDGGDDVDIDVVGLMLLGGTSPIRGWNTYYIARSKPTGLSVSQYDWSYVASGVTNTRTDTSGSSISIWSGKMVVSGALTVGATISGVYCSEQLVVGVQDRSGWDLPISCATDNESGWGDVPEAGAEFGQNRDESSDSKGALFVPQATDGDFSDAVTLSEVTSGPCEDWWYVGGSSLECDRETVINKYIKAGGPPPDGADDNFYDYNNENCIVDDMADFVQAAKNHEYRGTPAAEKSEEGHQGRIENGIDNTGIAGDPKVSVEQLVAQSDASLQGLVNDVVETLEDDLYNYALTENWSWFGPNWGSFGSLGAGTHARWFVGSETWSDCDSGPGNF
ncbi:MAG: hypothetical protein JXA69_06230 [Phycisphaerae bacterium]|nr:hypothetical protein [Phycisphaerae bacterium]